MIDTPLRHICEVCGKDEILTPEQAFNDGWDYPPRMGVFTVVGARTCGDCPINQTVWWAIMMDKRTDLTAREIEIVDRIMREPESLYV